MQAINIADDDDDDDWRNGGRGEQSIGYDGTRVVLLWMVLATRSLLLIVQAQEDSDVVILVEHRPDRLLSLMADLWSSQKEVGKIVGGNALCYIPQAGGVHDLPKWRCEQRLLHSDVCGV